MRRFRLALFLWLVLGLPMGSGPAGAVEPRFEFFGDFRFRLESDFDSRRADGSERDDRDRARVRLRAGLKAALAPLTSVGLRVRTGSRDSQQSAHVTIRDFDGNPRGDTHLLFDQWFARVEQERSWGWLGRNSFPFWKQNELFWDDDVTPVGLAAGHRFTAGEGGLELIGGYFTLPDGGVDLQGRLAAAQGVYSRRWSGLDAKAALGLFRFAGEEGARHLRQGNGERDYTIWIASFQAKWQEGDRPLTLGLDLIHNSESYRAVADPFAAALRDQTDGFVASVQWGDSKKVRSWLFGYYYGRIEALAVHASYAQDDWIRWGSATQVDGSDFRGHELRLAYAVSGKANLVARFYRAEAITSVQDGSRARIDFNLGF